MNIKNFLINIFKILIQSIIWIYKLLIQFIKFVDLKMNNFFIGIIENETSKNILRLVQFAILIIIFVFCINYFNNPISKENGYGPWGDFFGGVLNPILTFLTFMGLLITIIIQKKELKESRDVFIKQQEALEKQQKEMTIQSFDNKFFQMLNSFNKISDSLAINDSLQGKDVFVEHLEVLKQKIRYCYNDDLANRKTDENKIIYFLKIFNSFNNTYDTTFKYYFLNLYQLMSFIDKDIPYKASKKKKNAKKYTNIIRAQLSKNELVLLAYNAIGIIEFCGDDYKKLLEKYSFFEHLRYDDFNNEPYILSIVNSILIQYKSKVFGKNDAIIKQIERISKEVKDPVYQKPLSSKEIRKLIASLKF